MKSRAEVRVELAGAVARQRELKNERREAWRAARGEPVASVRCRALEREVDGQRAALRALTLAQRLVRGQTYWPQERCVRQPVARVLAALARVADVTETEAKAWVEAPVPAELRAAFDEHLAGVRVGARERKRSRAPSSRRPT